MRDRRIQAAVSAGIAVAVAVIAAVAAVDALRRPSGSRADAVGEPRETSDLRGPGVPARGRRPGTLFFLHLGGCRLRSVDLAAASLGEPGPRALCRLWASPTGEAAALPVERGFRAGAVTYEVVLVELAGRPTVERPLATVRGDVAWSADG